MICNAWLRFHDTIARLEIDADDLQRVVAPGVRDRIVALGKQLGFSYVALDLAGFRSGSLNEVLPAQTLVQLGGAGLKRSS
jgi:pyridinium-3,5-biscarboxylic acid mononucleotide sulfurtransferase